MKRAIFILCFAPILFFGCESGKSNKLGQGGASGDGNWSAVSGYNCASIDRCVKACASNDKACKADCIKGGSNEAAKIYADLETCIRYNCAFMSDDEAADCAENSCSREIKSCGLKEAPAGGGNNSGGGGSTGGGSGNSGSTGGDSGDSAADSGDSGGFCGDGFIQREDCSGYEDKGCKVVPGTNEICDDGEFNGKYNHCKSNCSGIGEYCGDGIKNGPEICDDGENNGEYGRCKSNCSGMDGSGGSTGGDTGGSTGGDTGGSTGGSTGGDAGGSTGGDTGGSTGGDTGGSTGGDTGGASDSDSYAVPYGKANIVIKSTYLKPDNEELAQNMIVMGPFASGTFGTAGNLEVSAPGAMQFYAALDTRTQDGSAVIGIVQRAQDQQGQKLFNPNLDLVINKAKLTTGAISVGLGQNDAAQFMVYDLTPDGKKISCYHAFGAGSLQVISAKLDPGAGANIEIKGELDLYSPKNWPEAGDISGQIGVQACPAQ